VGGKYPIGKSNILFCRKYSLHCRKTTKQAFLF